jgi:hypothetical protein
MAISPFARTTYTEKKSGQLFIPSVRFEPKTPVLRRTNTFRFLHLAASEISIIHESLHYFALKFPVIWMGIRSSGNVAKFKYLETTVINTNLIQEKIRRGRVWGSCECGNEPTGSVKY